MGFLLIKLYSMEDFDFFNKQKNYFFQGKTRSVDKRIEVLEKLDTSISKNEKNIFEALKKDLNKSNFESYLTEIAILKSEIRLIKKSSKNGVNLKELNQL